MNAKNNAQIVDAQAASQPKKNSVWVSVGLIVLVVVIAMFPLFFNYGDDDAEEPFAGTDATAT